MPRLAWLGLGQTKRADRGIKVMDKDLQRAYELVLADLEERNSHTLGRLLKWEISQDNSAQNSRGESEIAYRALLAAKNFMEAHSTTN
jgi:hypothetical protein